MGESVQIVESHRSIELVHDNSEEAIRLCAELLRPAADYLAGEQFMASDLMEVSSEQTLTHIDDTETYVAFTASKQERPIDLPEGEECTINYLLTLSVRRPYEKGMFWPGFTDLPLRPGDEIIEDFYVSEEGDTLQPRTDIDMSDYSVAEVWEYELDTELMKPRKTLRWLYFEVDEEEPAAIVEGNYEETRYEIILGEDLDEETTLRAMDREMTEAYSAEDVKVMVGLLKKFGFDNNFQLEKTVVDRQPRPHWLRFKNHWLSWLIKA